MATLRHVAFWVKDAQKMYDFHRQVFGIEQVRSSPNGKSIHVIDGLFNLAFLGGSGAANPDRVYGINHAGFTVDSLDEIMSRLDENLYRWKDESTGKPTEWSFYDPVGNHINIAERGYLCGGREEPRMPGIRHMVYQVDEPKYLADFYQKTFDLVPVQVNEDDGSVVLTDGDVTMAFKRLKSIGRTGIQHIGIRVDDWEQAQERFAQVGRELPDLAPGQKEARVQDPEGNLFSVSPVGWV